VPQAIVDRRGIGQHALELVHRSAGAGATQFQHKLWPAETQLVVGEGLETTLAAATRIPYANESLTPAWAALSAKKMKLLPPIPGVQKLVLLIDNDSNNEGQIAAETAAICWRAAGRVVVPLMPDTADTDFNDLVIKGDSHVAMA
jgi:Toprim domain